MTQQHPVRYVCQALKHCDPNHYCIFPMDGNLTLPLDSFARLSEEVAENHRASQCSSKKRLAIDCLSTHRTSTQRHYSLAPPNRPLFCHYHIQVL
jgi:hypothetical protein